MKSVGLILLGAAVCGCASNNSNQATSVVQAAKQAYQTGQQQVQSAQQQVQQAAAKPQTPTQIVSESQAAAQRTQSFKAPKPTAGHELGLRVAAAYEPIGDEWNHIYDPKNPPAPRSDAVPKKPAHAVELVQGKWYWLNFRWVWVPTHWVVSK